MAEEKNYDKGFIGNLLDGGASARLRPKNDDIKGARDLLAQTEGNVLSASGVAQSEVDAYVSAQLEANQSDYEATGRSIGMMSATNTVLNSLSFVPMASAGAKKVGAVASKAGSLGKIGKGASAALSVPGQSTAKTWMTAGKAAMSEGRYLTGIGNYMKAGTSYVGAAASKVSNSKVVSGARKGFKAVDDKLGKAADGISNIGRKTTINGSNTSVKESLGLLGRTVRGTTSFAVRNGAYIAPVVAAQMYTRGRVDAMDKDLSDTLELVLDRTVYVNTEGGKLAGEAGEAYSDWNDAYTADMDALSQALANGEISQSRYDELYEEASRESAEKLRELDGKYPELARKMVTEGEAYRIADTGAKIGADLDKVGKYDSQVGTLMDEHPEAKALHEQRKSEYAALDTGSSFMNFLSSMHAAVVHYLPGFAYLEAAAVKGVDMALGFAANNVPVLKDLIDYKERYEGRSLTSMASQIADTAEARYEAQSDASGTQQALRDGQDVSSPDREQDDGPEAAMA